MVLLYLPLRARLVLLRAAYGPHLMIYRLKIYLTSKINQVVTDAYPCYTLVGPPALRLVLDPLAVIFLDNRLYIDVKNEGCLLKVFIMRLFNRTLSIHLVMLATCTKLLATCKKFRQH